MEITQAVIPPPVFMTGADLQRALQELGATLIPLSSQRAARYDITIPDQQLQVESGLIVNVVVHGAPLLVPAQPQANPHLQQLEQLAKADPAMRRHRLFWQALADAKVGKELGPRQQQLLELVFERLETRHPRRQRRFLTPRKPQPAPSLNFRPAAQQQTLTPPAYAAWVQLQDGAALGNINLRELSGQRRPRRDERSLAPVRDDSWLPKLRPHMSDTDSGDES